MGRTSEPTFRQRDPGVPGTSHSPSGMSEDRDRGPTWSNTVQLLRLTRPGGVTTGPTRLSILVSHVIGNRRGHGSDSGVCTGGACGRSLLCVGFGRSPADAARNFARAIVGGAPRSCWPMPARRRPPSSRPANWWRARKRSRPGRSSRPRPRRSAATSRSRQETLDRREDSLDKKAALVDQKEARLAQFEDDLRRRGVEVDRDRTAAAALVEARTRKLEEVAGMTAEGARQTLTESMVSEARHAAARTVQQVREETERSARREAVKIRAWPCSATRPNTWPRPRCRSSTSRATT